jgi:hypothetical protein
VVDDGIEKVSSFNIFSRDDIISENPTESYIHVELA